MKPTRNPKYRAWLRKQPCCICDKAWSVEAAHTGPHGLGQKACDERALPLCWNDHRKPGQGLDKIGRVRFEERNNVSIEQLILVMRIRAEACRVETFTEWPKVAA